jgi:hypothetical protein
MQNFSKEYVENRESYTFALPCSIAMDVDEWSASGSGHFISDVPCMEVLRSLDVAAVLIIIYWKRTHNYKIISKQIREEKLLDQLKSITQYYYN